VQLPDANSPIPPKIRDSPWLYPFFDGVLGAIDVTHIRCTSSAKDRGAAKHKGPLTQYCVAAYTFDLRFTHLSLSGWEESTADSSDSTLFNTARQTDFYIPKGRYYLAVAGFESSDALLVPYDLPEWVYAERV
jgi:hypothetical protein